MPNKPTHTDNFTSADNLSIVWHRWDSNNTSAETKAIVVISHGFGEHALRYSHVAKHLTENGYIVYALDYRGHGASGGPTAQIKHIGDYQPDLAQLINLAKDEHPELPCVLFAHSMGGAVALGYALDHQDSLKGLMLSAPFLRNAAPVSPILINISKLLATVAPNLPIQAVDAEVISRIPEVVQAYKDDPLVYSGKLKASMGSAILNIGSELLAKVSGITLPTLIMHGEADALAGCEGSKELFESISSADKNLKLYPESYHEIVNDLDQDIVLADMTEWLNQLINPVAT